MTAHKPAGIPFHADTPAFLVGITGYRDLAPDDEESVKERLELIFRFLRQGADARDKERPHQTLLQSLVDQLVVDANDRETRSAYKKALCAWRGLPPNTPIVVLSALAPGTDSLVVDVALEEEFKDAGFLVRCPLPFPAELYRNTTTFVRENDSHLDNADRQADYYRLLARVGPENTFAVRLNADQDKTMKQLAKRKLPQSLKNELKRDKRDYAAGEFLAVYSHLLIAIWNGEQDVTVTGKAAAVEAR